MLFIESYAAGSHLRVARLLQESSRHHIDIIRLARDHWRTIALTGHRAIGDALRSIGPPRHDLIVFSGPADVRLANASIPEGWGRTPVVAYFHESQWTYPASSLDRIPHLVNHLETVEVCDASWFNSHFHRRTFFSSAWNHPSPSVRSLAREILPERWQSTDVVYPPVRVRQHYPRRGEGLSIAWTARWEAEKRPDLMLEVMRHLTDMGLKPKLHILGCSTDRWQDDPMVDSEARAIIQPQSGYLPRDAYESVLANSAFWLSTAEHEFFGVSAVEAAMLGATPVVPNDLAYPETLPSAVTYPPGDAPAAARRIAAMHRAGRLNPGPWQLDALRFHIHRSVNRFDDAVERVVLGNRRTNQGCKSRQPWIS